MSRTSATTRTFRWTGARSKSWCRRRSTACRSSSARGSPAAGRASGRSRPTTTRSSAGRQASRASSSPSVSAVTASSTRPPPVATSPSGSWTVSPPWTSRSSRPSASHDLHDRRRKHHETTHWSGPRPRAGPWRRSRMGAAEEPHLDGRPARRRLVRAGGRLRRARQEQGPELQHQGRAGRRDPEHDQAPAGRDRDRLGVAAVHRRLVQRPGPVPGQARGHAARHERAWLRPRAVLRRRRRPRQVDPRGVREEAAAQDWYDAAGQLQGRRQQHAGHPDDHDGQHDRRQREGARGARVRVHEDPPRRPRGRPQGPPRLQGLQPEGRRAARQRPAPSGGREGVQGSGSPQLRKLGGPVGWAVGGWAAAAALFHIWTAYAGVWEPREMRATHLLFLLPLAFLLFPATGRSPTDRVTRWDWAGVALSIVPCAYVLANVHALTERWEGVHPVTLSHVLMGTLMVAMVLEASRRAVGFWFFVTTLAFIAFLVAAPWLPGFLKSPRAYSYPRLIEMFFLYADEGVLGSLTGISSNILMIFILFASFMLHSGVGQFFMDISVALAGRFRGGPAKVAVLSSGLYGTISGSSVADCYATGSFTIPLMKRIGYKPEIAGAIEACASCGGPLMPPIMGAGAFIMAELTGVPYSKIIVAAALPAVLYYVGIMATVHWEAIKQRIGTMTAEVPSSDRMRTGWQASRIAISGFLAPFLFVYQPALLMEGSLPEIVLLFASAVVGISALSAAAAGYMFRKLGWPQRALLIAVSLAAISPPPAVSGATSLALVAFGAWGWSRPRREGARPGSVAPPGRCGLARCPRRGAQGLRVQRRAPTSGLPASVAVGDVPLRVHAPQRLRLGEATPEEACEDESAQAGSLPRARDQHAHAQGQVGCHRRFSWSASRKRRIFRRLRPARCNC